MEPAGHALRLWSWSCQRGGPNRKQELAMNWDQIEGKWKQFKGQAREQWGKITDDEYESVAGKRDQMVGLVQQKYGHAKEDAEREVDDWFSKL
jgi:uncharacterized protein YjbJ (UPF0337 family)